MSIFATQYDILFQNCMARRQRGQKYDFRFAKIQEEGVHHLQYLILRCTIYPLAHPRVFSAILQGIGTLSTSTKHPCSEGILQQLTSRHVEQVGE